MLYDIQWKKIITSLTEHFLMFFFPNLIKDIDPDGEIELMQQEFFPDTEQDKPSLLRADLVLKIPLINGEFTYCILHIEAQTESSSDFKERMLWYFINLFTRFHPVPIMALAILSDGTSQKKFDTFTVEFHNTVLSYQYNIYNVMTQSEEELLAMDNPFALVIVAMKRRRKVETEIEKLLFRRELIKLMKERDYPEQITKVLVELVSQLFALEKKLQLEEEAMKVIGGLTEQELEWEVEIARKTQPSVYTIGKKDGIEKGIEIGTEKGIEKGIEIGTEKGRFLEKKNMVIRADALGSSPEEIALLADIPIEQVYSILHSRQ